MPTQRQRAEALLAKVKLPERHEIEQLTDIVGESQNRPPLGRADDSISDKAWHSLADCQRALSTLQRAIREFRERLS